MRPVCPTYGGPGERLMLVERGVGSHGDSNDTVGKNDAAQAAMVRRIDRPQVRCRPDA